MMKKTLAISFALLLVLCFAACAKKDITPSDGSNTEEQTEVHTTEPAITEDDISALEKELADKAEEKPETIIPVDNGYLAPAEDAATGLWGYINSKGEWVIDPEYAAAYPFENGYACVLNEGATRYLMINTSGEVYVEKINKLYLEACSHYSEGYLNAKLASGYEQSSLYFSVDGVTMLTAEGLPTLKGGYYQSKTYFAVAGHFKNGVAVVMRRTNESVLENNNNNYASIKSKGLFESAYVIDAWGQVLATLPAGYDVNEYALDDNGRIIAKDMTTEDGLYYLCDTEGGIVSVGYRRIEHCEGKMYLVCDAETGFWGYIDTDGKLLVLCSYDSALPFSEGLAAVCEGELWGVIDEKGDYVILPEWDEILPGKYADITTNSDMAAFSSGAAVARKGNYWAIIDSDGHIISAVYSDNTEESPYKSIANGFVAYEENGLWGLMNLDNEKVTDAVFADLEIFNN